MKPVSFVTFSRNIWGKRFARKQQFMLYLAKRTDTGNILYVEPPYSVRYLLMHPPEDDEEKKRMTRAFSGRIDEVAEKIFVYTPLFLIPGSIYPFIHRLNYHFVLPVLRSHMKKLGLESRYVLWLYQPYDRFMLDIFSDRLASVFDWAEIWWEYHTELPARLRKTVRKLEFELVRKADITFCLSEEQMKVATSLGVKPVFLPSGTSIELFDSPSSLEPPPEIAGIRHPVIGWTGSIVSRFDVPLWKKLALSMPDCTFVTVGSIENPLWKELELETLPNIRHFKLQPYERMLRFLNSFDVATMPYIVDMTKFEPTKIYDYLGAGKPVVSSAIPEIYRFRRHVRIACDPASWQNAIRTCLSEWNEEKSRAMKEYAKNHSWSRRAERIMEVLSYRLPSLKKR